MVVQGLERHFVPAFAAAGFSRNFIYREFLPMPPRSIRVLPYQPLKPSMALHWLDLVAANPRFQFTAKLWQKFTHETGRDRRGRTSCARRLRRCLRPRASSAPCCCSFRSLSITRRKISARLKRMLGTFQRISARRRSAPCFLERQPEFYDCLHERGVGFCNIDQPVIGRSVKPVRARTATRRLHPPARAALRHMVQRRSGTAARGTLQLSCIRKRN